MKTKTNRYSLSNGVRVLELDMVGAESTVVLVLVKTGSRNESDKQAGISHVLEHMVFKGTEKYPSPMALAEAVDALGAEFNAFTGKEYTGYYIKAASDHFGASSHILAEMMTKPLLKSDDLEREKGVIIEEINMYEDLPMERAGEEFENLLFAGNLGRLIIGSKETVSSLSDQDLREYMSKWYRGGNVVVVVAGKVGSDSKDVLEREFGGLGEGTVLDYVSDAELGGERVFKLPKDTEQAHFVMGVPALSMDDPRRYAMTLLRIALGGNMSSRLFTEVREKRGWAYYVRAIKEEHIDAGYMAVRAGVKMDVLDQAQELVRAEMLRIGSDISEKEVRRAKDFFRGVFTLSLEDNMDVAKLQGEAVLLLDKERDLQEIMDRVENTTLEEVKEIASTLIREEEIRVAVVAPEK